MPKRGVGDAKLTKQTRTSIQYLDNLAKSIGITLSHTISDVAPNLSTTVVTGSKVATTAYQTLRNNRQSINRINKSLENNQYIKIAKKALKNIGDDLKSGKIQNEDRDPFGGGFSFGDDDIDSGVEESLNETTTAVLDLSDQVQKQSIAQVKTAKASMDAMISISSAQMAMHQQSNAEIINYLDNINNNLTALVKFQNENVTNYISASMAYMERTAPAIIGDSEADAHDANKKVSANDVFTNGRFNPQNYGKYIKQQAKKYVADSPAGMMLSMLADPNMLEMLASNPLGTAADMLAKSFMPEMMKRSIEAMEKSFTNFVPAYLAKIAEMTQSNESGVLGDIKRAVGSIFGFRADEKKTNLRDAKIERGAIPFDGETKHAITTIITKELREQTSLLKLITRELTGKTMNQVKTSMRGHEEYWDYESNSFIKGNKIDQSIAKKILNDISLSYYGTDFGKRMNNLVVAQGDSDSKEAKEMSRALDLLYFELQNQNKNVDLNDVISIVGKIGVNNKTKELIKNYVSQMASNDADAFNSVNVGRFSARAARNSTMKQIEANPSQYHLFESGFNTDFKNEEEFNNFLINAFNQGAKKGNYDFKNAADIEDTSIDPNTGRNFAERAMLSIAKGFQGTLAGILHGNVNVISDQLGNLVKDGAKLLKEGATKSLIGKTNDLGDLEGGFFSNIINETNNFLFGKRNDQGDREGGALLKAKEVLKTGVEDWISFFFGKKEETPQETTERLKTFLSDGKDSAIKGAFAGFLAGFSPIGMITGGPIGSAALGAASGFMSKSEKFMDFFFGKKDPDSQDGERMGGLISKRTQELFKAHKMEIGAGAGLGAVAGTMLGGESLGVLGSLFGGPIAGAMMGVAGGILSKSNMVQRFLFGDEERGTEGLFKAISSGWKSGQKNWRNAGFPTDDSKLLGMGAVGALTGAGLAKFGILGGALMPFGPIGGAVAGLGLAVAASGKSFKEALFGGEAVFDKNGNLVKIGGKDYKKKGLFGHLENSINANLINPTRTALFNAIERTALNIESGFLIPAKYIAKFGARTLAKTAGKVAGMFTHTAEMLSKLLGNSKLGNALMALAGGAASLGTNALSAMVNAPMNLVRNVTGGALRIFAPDIYEEYKAEQNTNKKAKRLSKQNAANRNRHTKNSKLIFKLSGGEFSEDTDEAREYIKQVDPESYARYFEADIKDENGEVISKNKNYVGTSVSQENRAAKMTNKELVGIAAGSVPEAAIASFDSNAQAAIYAAKTMLTVRQVRDYIMGNKVQADNASDDPNNSALQNIGDVNREQRYQIQMGINKVVSDYNDESANATGFFGRLAAKNRRDKAFRKLRKKARKETIWDKSDFAWGGIDTLNLRQYDRDEYYTDGGNGLGGRGDDATPEEIKRATPVSIVDIRAPRARLLRFGGLSSVDDGTASETAAEYRDRTAKEEEKKETKDFHTKVLEAIDKVNNTETEAKDDWNAIFSKKGLIGAGLILATPFLLKAFRWLVQNGPEIWAGLKDLAKNVGNILAKVGDLALTFGKDVADQAKETAENRETKNGETPAQLIDDIISHPLEALSLTDPNGEITATTNAKARVYSSLLKHWWRSGSRYADDLARHGSIPGRVIQSTMNGIRKTGGAIKSGASKAKYFLTKDGREYISANLFKNGKTAKAVDNEYDLINRMLRNQENAAKLSSGVGKAADNYVDDALSIIARNPDSSALDLMEAAQNAGSRLAGSNVDDIAATIVRNGADEAAETASKTATKYSSKIAKLSSSAKYTDEILEGGAKLVDKGDDVLRATAKNSDGLLNTVKNYIDDFFKFITTKFAQKTGKEVGEKAFKYGPTALKKIVTSKWDDLCLKIAQTLGIKGGAAAVSFGLSEAIFATIGAVDGVTGTAKLFHIDKSKVDGTMRLIAGIIGGLAGTTVGGIIDLVLAVATAVTGVDILRSIAETLYKALVGDDAKVQKLQEAQKEFQDQYLKYQEGKIREQYATQRATGMIGDDVTEEQFIEGVRNGTYNAIYDSEDDYNAKQNASIIDKGIGAVGKVAKTLWKGVRYSGVGKALLGYNPKVYKDKQGNFYFEQPDHTFLVKIPNEDGTLVNVGAIPKESLPDDIIDISEEYKQDSVFAVAGHAISDAAKKIAQGAKEAAAFLKEMDKNLSERNDLIGNAYKVAKESAKILISNLTPFGKGAKIAKSMSQAKSDLNKLKRVVYSLTSNPTYYYQTNDGKRYELRNAYGQRIYDEMCPDGYKSQVTLDELKSYESGGLVHQTELSDSELHYNFGDGIHTLIGTVRNYGANTLNEAKNWLNALSGGRLFGNQSTGSSIDSLPIQNAEKVKSNTTINSWENKNMELANSAMNDQINTTAGGYGLGGRGPYFSNNNFYRNMSYGPDATMDDSGCGPFAFANTLDDMGFNAHPMQMANLAIATGNRDATGTNANFISDAASLYGLNTDQVYNPDSYDLASQLASGSPVIALGQTGGYGLGGRGHFTKAGHYVELSGLYGNGTKTYLTDSRGPQYSGLVDLDEVSPEVGSSWAFNKSSGLGGYGRRKHRFGGRGPEDDYLNSWENKNMELADAAVNDQINTYADGYSAPDKPYVDYTQKTNTTSTSESTNKVSVEDRARLKEENMNKRYAREEAQFQKNEEKREKETTPGVEKWLKTVAWVKDYASHKQGTYNQSGSVTIEIADGTKFKMRTDCSGFVSVCLQIFGHGHENVGLPQGMVLSSSGFASKNHMHMSTKSGFIGMDWPGWENLQPGDIIARSGHVEIFDHNEGSKHKVWNWGSGSSAAVSTTTYSSHPSYTTVWRCNTDGNAMMGDGTYASDDGSYGSSTTGNASATGGRRKNPMGLWERLTGGISAIASTLGSKLLGDTDASYDEALKPYRYWLYDEPTTGGTTSKYGSASSGSSSDSYGNANATMSSVKPIANLSEAKEILNGLELGQKKTSFFGKVLNGALVSKRDQGVLPSITMSQAALESGWGDSGLASKYNNLFGIKAGSKWTGQVANLPTKEEVNGVKIDTTAAFRAYPSWDDSIIDHGKLFVNNPSRYGGILSASNYEEAAKALGSSGYATSSSYGTDILNTIVKNKLYSFDKFEPGADSGSSETTSSDAEITSVGDLKQTDYEQMSGENTTESSTEAASTTGFDRTNYGQAGQPGLPSHGLGGRGVKSTVRMGGKGPIGNAINESIGVFGNNMNRAISEHQQKAFDKSPLKKTLDDIIRVLESIEGINRNGYETISSSIDGIKVGGNTIVAPTIGSGGGTYNPPLESGQNLTSIQNKRKSAIQENQARMMVKPPLY